MSQYYNYKTAVIILLMSLVAYLVLVIGLYNNPDILGSAPQAMRYFALIFFELLLLGPLLLYVIGNKKSIKHAFRLRPVSLYAMRDVFLVALGLFVCVELIQLLFYRIFHFRMPLLTDIRLEYTVNILLLFPLIAIIVPIVEEALFRGYLLRVMLRNRYSPFLAILTTALLFTLSHLTYTQAPGIFIAGLILGFVAYTYYSIIPAIVIHSLYNIMVLVDVNIPQLRNSVMNAKPYVAWAIAVGGMLALILGLINIRNHIQVHRKRRHPAEGGMDEE
jgi:membrane protease YdiL (CAAX protease family)